MVESKVRINNVLKQGEAAEERHHAANRQGDPTTGSLQQQSSAGERHQNGGIGLDRDPPLNQSVKRGTSSAQPLKETAPPTSA
jgi:hypothetical protein